MKKKKQTSVETSRFYTKIDCDIRKVIELDGELRGRVFPKPLATVFFSHRSRSVLFYFYYFFFCEANSHRRLHITRGKCTPSGAPNEKSLFFRPQGFPLCNRNLGSNVGVGSSERVSTVSTSLLTDDYEYFSHG